MGFVCFLGGIGLDILICVIFYKGVGVFFLCLLILQLLLTLGSCCNVCDESSPKNQKWQPCGVFPLSQITRHKKARACLSFLLQQDKNLSLMHVESSSTLVRFLLILSYLFICFSKLVNIF